MQSVPVSDTLTVQVPDGLALTNPVRFTEQMLKTIDFDVSPVKMVPGDWSFLYGPVGFVPGTKDVAFGFFKPGIKRLDIRYGMNLPTSNPKARNLTKQETIYTCSHEWLGHGSDYKYLTNWHREKILHEMGLDSAIAAAEATGLAHDKAIIYVWNRGDFVGAASKVRYWERPYEAYADMIVSALTSFPSIFEPKYTWNISADKLKEIVLSAPPVVTPPTPGPTPEPVPVPDPPQTITIAAGQTLVVTAQ